MLTILTTLLALALSPAHALARSGLTPAGLTEDAIYRGTRVGADGQTWKSAIQLYFNGYACSGVFIRRDVILTAAHCEIQRGAEVTVKYFRANDPAQAEHQYLSASDYKTYAHPSYSGAPYFENDYRVIVLTGGNEIRDGFAPVGFITSDYGSAVDPGGTVYIVGAGTTGNDVSADRLSFAKGRIDYYGNGSRMMISVNPGQGVCQGDSGGPVYVSAGGGLVLAGITSSTSNLHGISRGCGTAHEAGLMSADVTEWIRSKADEARAD